MGIRFFRMVLRPILGKPVHDPTSGFVGVNHKALEVFSRSFPLEYPEIEALVGKNVFRWQTLNARSRRGVIGNGAAGTADKGERLLEAMSDRVFEVLATPELWTVKASERW